MVEKVNLQTMRHSCSHLLAMAVSDLWPKTKFSIGPAIDNGFYYDFDFLKLISDKDLVKIEAKMKDLQKQKFEFIKKEISFLEAKKIFKDQSYKLELIEEIEKKGEVKNVSVYQSNNFIDLCHGPHLESTKQIGPFKLLSVAGAYWRGSEKNKMLTRVYGTCFPTQKELDNYLAQQKEAKKRDHRLLNKTLKLYFLSDELGQGLATLLPNGAIIAEELEKWAKEVEEKWGYVRVFTPHIAREKLLKKSGHVPYYTDHMYPPMRMEEKGKGETEVYYMKPMNCAGHHLVYKNQPRSYRDLPLRIAEYGAVYRYEQSGELHGLMRVRGPIHQNDAHIFCTENQAGKEFQKVMALHKYYYDTLGLEEKDYFLSFAIRDKKAKGKYLGSPKMWDKAEKITLEYIKKSKIPYEIEEGGAAFYGPKIDFNIRTVTGKVFAASTNQLDFFIPQAFGLKYTDKDGKQKTPVCIHRAPLGAHVRFVAFLTEHFGGNFPAWLSPIQVKVIPITDRNVKYAQKIAGQLIAGKLRTELDDRNETTSAKIRDAQIQKIPHMIIVGDREEKSKTISHRTRSGKNCGSVKLDKFIAEIKVEIEEKIIN